MALKTFSELAAVLRSEQDESLRRTTLSPVGERVDGLRALRAERQRARRIRRTVGVALVAAASVSAFLLVPAQQTFEVGTTRAPGATGVWLTTPPGEEVPLHFSDGSLMILDNQARFRVERIDRRGAKVVVEKGTVRASVVPRPENKWIVAVGPFQIQVRGTKFDASWQPDLKTFRLQMREGVVMVRGGCLDAPRSAADQESFEVTCPVADPASITSIAALEPASSLVSPETSSSAPAALLDVGSTVVPAASRADWRALIQQHDPRGAVEIEEAGAFDITCQTSPLSDLTALAEAARHAGRAGRAQQTYTAIRTRFAGSEAAANSAFHLGRLAWNTSNRQQARMWFSTYLAERPGGALAQEALGRILEVDQRGDEPLARETARRYLAQFPGGPHASLAQSVLAP